MDDHSHNHGHHHHTVNSKNLLFTAVLNIAITIVEFVGALFSGSLALMSDATHNFSDAISVTAAYIANRAGKKEANLIKTYGYKRVEIITALFNAITLLIITVFIFKEAIERLFIPKAIESSTMILVAAIGLVANVLGAILLHHDSRHNLNIKASYLHLISDAFASVLVIIGGAIVHWFQILWIDSALSFLIGFFILWNAIYILKNTFFILMQSTPEGIDILEICKEIEALPEVCNVHHVHAWSLDEHNKFLECHVCTNNDLKISETQEIRKNVEHIAFEHFGFNHVTVQIEFTTCEDSRIIQ